MNDELSLASSYYEILENLSVIWEETSQDLHSIVTNPKHRRRLSNGPIPYPPSSPRLSPKKVDGTPRTSNIRKSPLLRKNLLSLGQAPIAELEESQENTNATENQRRDSIFVTSLRTGELVALPLQDDEFTFESCTTGSDMQSVESIEEYISGEDQQKRKSRQNGNEEPTDDEHIFEIVDELKEELVMIKHARDEAMKALYLHDSPLTKTQRDTISKEEFLSRMSTVTKVPNFWNICEITDSSSLPDVLPSVKEAAVKDDSATSGHAKETKGSLPAEDSASLDSNFHGSDGKDASSATESADPANTASLTDPLSVLHASTHQGDTSLSSHFIASTEQDDQPASPQSPATADHRTSASGPPPSKRDAKDPSVTASSLSLNESSAREAIASELIDLTSNTASQAQNVDAALSEGTSCAPLEAPSTLDYISPQAVETHNASDAKRGDGSMTTSSIEAPPTLDQAAPSPDPPIGAPATNVQEESEVSVPEEEDSTVNQTIPALHVTLMKKWLISNLKPSFFDAEHRQAFRINIDRLAGQRRRVQYNSSRLLLKRRLRKYLKAEDRQNAAQRPYEELDQRITVPPSNSDNESIEIFVANPQDDCQDKGNTLLGRHRLRRSNRTRSEGDLRNAFRAEKRAELRSKIHGIEDQLERIRLNLSSSFSSLPSIENGEEDVDVAAEEDKLVSPGWSSRSFSEGMMSPHSPPRERKGLKGRLDLIRGKKKLNLEKLQHALDSAMEAIAIEES
ncbi:MAG: hypothetical protein SGBAC_004188 [Bacillariaceae sp.]